MVYSEKKKFAWGVIALYVAIVLFGWFNIYAAVYDDAHTAVFDLTRQHGKQLLWIGLAWLTAVFILFVEPKVFSNIAYIVYAVVLGLLVITQVKHGESYEITDEEIRQAQMADD